MKNIDLMKTGLKSSEGKDIYTGDVLEHIDTGVAYKICYDCEFEKLEAVNINNRAWNLTEMRAKKLVHKCC